MQAAVGSGLALLRTGDTVRIDLRKCTIDMLIDDAVMRMTAQAGEGLQSFDRDGEIAAAGTIHQPLLEELLHHPYYRQAPPKTTGREEFGRQYGAQIWRRATEMGVQPADLLTYVGMSMTMVIIGLLASYLPARRASRVDPIESLRIE